MDVDRVDIRIMFPNYKMTDVVTSCRGGLVDFMSGLLPRNLETCNSEAQFNVTTALHSQSRLGVAPL